MIWILVAAAVLAGVVFIRVAPDDVTRWHQPVGAAENTGGEGWAARVVPDGAGMLSDLHQRMLALPRTRMLAGSIAEGRVTYVTRSRWMGFPDYTTIEAADGQIKLYARLRFGRSDLGVNGRRLDGLLQAVRAKRAEG